MKTEYKYINFKQLRPKKIIKTTVWSCRNNTGGYELGIVKWYPQWRQYSFYPADGMVFNQTCMEDIIHFINQLREQRKYNWMSKGANG